MLDDIWATGLETLRANAEDSVVDSVRERGEWVGDVATGALNLLAAGWGDVRLVRRALLHAAAGARPDGLVAGCGPGGLIYVGTYAAQWVTACVNLARSEGDLDFLHEVEEPARANVDAIVRLIDDDGGHRLPWSFVDWGYTAPEDQADLAVIAHAHQAVCSWQWWMAACGKPETAELYGASERKLAAVLKRWMPQSSRPYHSWTLGAHTGVVDNSVAARTIIEHVERGFPFERSAARLRDPGTVIPNVVTPYFTNYSFPVLLEAGHDALVADLWRRGWGWMLERGATTWWEVFDERWSQCHSWSGAPTWQMSRYGLGLHFDVDHRGPLMEIRVSPLGLDSLSGTMPMPGGALAEVRWERSDRDTLTYLLGVPERVRLRRGGAMAVLEAGEHEFELGRAHARELYR